MRYLLSRVLTYDPRTQFLMRCPAFRSCFDCGVDPNRLFAIVLKRGWQRWLIGTGPDQLAWDLTTEQHWPGLGGSAGRRTEHAWQG